MKIKKITTGFVVQEFDTELGTYISQEVIASDEVAYEIDELDWSQVYDNDECPDCGEPIGDAKDGDGCGNCGHVFWKPDANDVSDAMPSPEPHLPFLMVQPAEVK